MSSNQALTCGPLIQSNPRWGFNLRSPARRQPAPLAGLPAPAPSGSERAWRWPQPRRSSAARPCKDEVPPISTGPNRGLLPRTQTNSDVSIQGYIIWNYHLLKHSALILSEFPFIWCLPVPIGNSNQSWRLSDTHGTSKTKGLEKESHECK